MKCWVNGVETTQYQVNDRGLHYGDGFFTTVKVVNAALWNWTAHRQRIERSLQVLGLPEALITTLETQIRQVVSVHLSDGVLKILITRGEMCKRGYAPSSAGMPTILIQFFSELPPPAAPATVALSEITWPAMPYLKGIKHLNCLPQVMAAMQRPEGCDDVLMLDAQHQVISAMACAVVGQLGRTFYLPDLSQCGVRSTTVEALQVAAWSQGYQWQVLPLTMHRLLQMDSFYLLNAVQGLRPVERLQAHVEKRFSIAQASFWQLSLEAVLKEQAWDVS